MKRIGIKLKVTLWYSFIMGIVGLGIIAAMLILSHNVVETNMKKVLKEYVKEVAEDDVDYNKNGEIKIDKDLDFYNNGVYISIYNEDFEFIEGETPDGYKENIEFDNKETQSVTINGKEYYVYDKKASFKNNDDILVRGFISATSTADIVNSIIKLSIIVFPFLLILTILGAYLITKKAFEPINRINEAAKEISNGSDLSKRINLGEGRDEVYKLAQTFDNMFARLEMSFDNEKQFTSDVSHELRTPIAVILTECEYALENAVDEEEYKEALEVIKRQGKRMSSLVSQLLTLSRLEKNSYKKNFEVFNVSDMLEIICEEQEEINTRDIKLICDIETDMYIEGDETLMTRLFINLISNAYKYGIDGGYIHVKGYSKNNMFNFSVEDNGIGIEKENLNKIWNRFYTVDSSRNSSQEGSMGLGLSMVKWIAKFHDGDIKVESKVKEGSKFTYSMKLWKN